MSPTLSLSCAAPAAAFALVLALPGAAVAAQPAVGLGTATSYAVLAGSTVTNTGPSTISGDLGVSPGAAVTGFPPGNVRGGAIHAADAAALQAKRDLVTAYDDAAGRGPLVAQVTADLGGQRLLPGVYRAGSGLALTGTVTLDGQGDPAAVFVLQAGSTLVTATSSTVALVGGAQACNVFWQVGSSATIGTDTTFVGSVLALSDISLQTRATVDGRMLARNGAVTLDSNTITRPVCTTPTTTTPVGQVPTSAAATATSAPSTAATATPSTTRPTTRPSAKPSTRPSATGKPTRVGTTPTRGPDDASPTDDVPGSTAVPQDSTGLTTGTDTGTPTDGTGTPVPVGHPETGRVPTPSGHGWWGPGLGCLSGAAVLGARRSRRTRGGAHRLA